MVRTVGTDRDERKVIDDIREFGWHCLHILGEGEHVGYSFTVGLYQSYGHPELIIFGLSSQVAHDILAIAADAAKSGSPLDLTQATDAFVEGYFSCFTEVPKLEYREYVGFARWYYHGNDFPLYQIVWPSKSGVFPWHPTATPEFRAAQPVIAAPHGT